MGDIGRIITEGEFPHSADYLSLWLSDAQLGFIVKGVGNECELSIDGDDVVVKDGKVWFGDVGEARSFSEDSVTPSASADDGHRYDVLCFTKDNGGVELEYKEGDRVVYEPAEGNVPKHPDLAHPTADEIEIPIAIVHFEPNQTSITELKDSRTIRELNARRSNFEELESDVEDLEDYEILDLGGADGGQFHDGKVRIEKIGNQIILYGVPDTDKTQINHDKTNEPSTTNDFIPSQFLPLSSVSNVYRSGPIAFEEVTVTGAGSLYLSYRDDNLDSIDKENPGSSFIISYTIGSPLE